MIIYILEQYIFEYLQKIWFFTIVTTYKYISDPAGTRSKIQN